MNESIIIELPSGRMVNIDNIIYISDIKNKQHILEGDQWYFNVLWINGQKVSINFNNYEQCEHDWLDLKNVIKNQTNKMICS